MSNYTKHYLIVSTPSPRHKFTSKINLRMNIDSSKFGGYGSVKEAPPIFYSIKIIFEFGKIIRFCTSDQSNLLLRIFFLFSNLIRKWNFSLKVENVHLFGGTFAIITI